MKNSKKSRDFFCENCGNRVSADAKKCPNCGKEFVAVRCPQCSFSGKQELFIDGCPVCGYSASDLGKTAGVWAGQGGPEAGLSSGDLKVRNGFGAGKDRGAKMSETAKRWLFRLLGLFLIGAVILILILYMRL